MWLMCFLRVCPNLGTHANFLGAYISGVYGPIFTKIGCIWPNSWNLKTCVYLPEFLADPHQIRYQLSLTYWRCCGMGRDHVTNAFFVCMAKFGHTLIFFGRLYLLCLWADLYQIRVVNRSTLVIPDSINPVPNESNAGWGAERKKFNMLSGRVKVNLKYLCPFFTDHC